MEIYLKSEVLCSVKAMAAALLPGSPITHPLCSGCPQCDGQSAVNSRHQQLALSTDNSVWIMNPYESIWYLCKLMFYHVSPTQHVSQIFKHHLRGLLNLHGIHLQLQCSNLCPLRGWGCAFHPLCWSSHPRKSSSALKSPLCPNHHTTCDAGCTGVEDVWCLGFFKKWSK